MSLPRFLADEDLRYTIVRATKRLEPKIVFNSIVRMGLSGITDEEVLEFAFSDDWLLVSHDINTMKAVAEKRMDRAIGISGLFLVPQNRNSRVIAESLLLIWSASEAEEWKDRIIFLPL